MHDTFCHSRLGKNIAMTLLVTAIVLHAVPTPAQMQIPNPLIRPHSLTSGNGEQNLVPGATPPAQRAPQPIYNATPTLSAPAVQTNDPYVRDLADLRDRLSAFYVSAIVGKKAILRRSAALQRAGSTQVGSQTVGSSMAPQPLNAGTGNQGARNDSITVSDGELLEAVSNTGTLMTKVAKGRVVIYHIQELGNLSGGRLAGRRAIVFAGDVENSGTPLASAIVLERSDPAFRRFISVDTKVRSASAASADVSAPGPSTAVPAAQ